MPNRSSGGYTIWGRYGCWLGNISTEADEGGQYSDLLVVEVPFDLSRVGGFLAVWEAEFGRMDDYQASSTLLYFWWD